MSHQQGSPDQPSEGRYGAGVPPYPSAGNEQPYPQQDYPEQAYQQPGYQQPGYSGGYQQPGHQQQAYGQQVYGQSGFQQYQTPYSQSAYFVPPQPKTLSLTSMILGIASLIGFGYLILPSVAAVITGHMGLRRESPQGRGFAIAGLVLGYLSLALYAAIWVATIMFILYAANQDYSTYRS
ncbi:MAG: hypothetical protein JWO93_1990 [Micrococcaceae bacterium]|nr:hypothetical protein [Micrococcaceae bacterium]